MLGRVRQTLYAGFGLLCVVLGVIGALLPVVPTTPFLVLALWAFSSSSKRLEAWLLAHRHLGPRLVAWRTHRVIPLPVKLMAWGSMTGSLTVMAFVGAPPLALGGAASLMAIGAYYISRCPSRPVCNTPACTDTRSAESSVDQQSASLSARRWDECGERNRGD